MRRPLLLIGALALAVAIVWAAASVATDPVYSGNEEANGLLASGDLRSALDRYRELQRQRAGVGVVAVNAASTLYRLDDFGHALAEYDGALKISDGATRAAAFYDRGNTLFRLGRYEDARESYRDALRIDHGDRDAKIDLEIIERLFARLRQGRPGDDGAQAGGQSGQGQQQGQPGDGGQNAQQPGQTGQQQPGSPSGDAQNVGGPSANLGRLLDQFRRDLTAEEAQRVLDAIRAQQRGIGQLIEGPPPRRGNEPLY